MLRSILAPNPSAMTLDGTRTYVLGDRQPIVIDPGPDDAGHLDAIIAALGGASPAILLSHLHADHAAGAKPLAERTCGRILAGKAALAESHIETDEGPVQVLSGPGHTPDHLLFRWGAGDALFVGDAFMGGLDTVLVAPPEGDLAAYLLTLDRVEALAPAVLHPAHGPSIPDGAAAARRYRRHRMERIGQVQSALETLGPSRADQLVDAVYGAELDPELRAAAAGSVRAVVEYLMHGGRAERSTEGLIRLIV